MGDVVPAWGSGASPVVDDILAAVFSGDTWPEGSETAARVVAQQFQQFYDILADAGTDYVTAAMQVAAGWEGVTGQSFEQFVRGGWERLDNCAPQEQAAALVEIAKIATHRFDRLVADANPVHSARVRHLDT